MRVAIIGSGIAGLSCAYKLFTRHDITVFEAADYAGGHTHTVDVEEKGELSRIDTGFIVFNERTYPNFMQLLDEIGVVYQPTEMSFSVRNDSIGLEYNGNNLKTLFAQRRNLFRPRFYSMLAEIVRFNREVKAAGNGDSKTTLGDFLATGNFSSLFRENYILPMVSAIWSMGIESCMDFPLPFFVRFFDNHGLFDLINRPQWYTIKGGSSTYINPLTRGFKDRLLLNTPVVKVVRDTGKVKVITNQNAFPFDHVVFACHADQALALLERPTSEEIAVLGRLRFSTNTAILHTDTSFLPKRKLAWASWNYNMIQPAKEQSTLTYNMNILQRLRKKHTYLVTLNQDIPEEHVLKSFIYHHPIYTMEAIRAQQDWHTISGRNRSHYCGAYWFNGFHEDGVKSALRVASGLEGKI